MSSADPVTEKPAAGLTLRERLGDAARYWEPHRLRYNLVLTLVALVWLLSTWPHFRPALAWRTVPPLLVLAALANLCYCAAYVFDVTCQHAASRDAWRRSRWVLWVAGTVVATLLECYWIADEIYPAVN